MEEKEGGGAGRGKDRVMAKLNHRYQPKVGSFRWETDSSLITLNQSDAWDFMAVCQCHTPEHSCGEAARKVGLFLSPSLSLARDIVACQTHTEATPHC